MTTFWFFLGVVAAVIVPTIAFYAVSKVRGAYKGKRERKEKEERRFRVVQMLRVLLDLPLDELGLACEEAGIDFGQESLQRLSGHDPDEVGRLYGSLLHFHKSKSPEEKLVLFRVLANSLTYLDFVEDTWKKSFLEALDKRHPEEGYGEELSRQIKEITKERVMARLKNQRKEVISKGIEAFRAS